MTQSYDARTVANALLDIAEARRTQLTHMAVHKIIFYAHGWRLAQSGDPLVKQEFEAWRDGPVLRIVWESLRAAGSAPVRARATRFDPVNRTSEIVSPLIEADDHALLANVLSAYGHLHAYDLSAMTHFQGSPWDQVWNARDGKISLGMRIPHSLIRNHFEKRSFSELKSS